MRIIKLSEKATFYTNMYAAIYLACNDFDYAKCQSSIDNNDNWEDCVKRATKDCDGDENHPSFSNIVMSYYEPQIERLAMEIWTHFKEDSPKELDLFSVMELMKNPDYNLV